MHRLGPQVRANRLETLLPETTALLGLRSRTSTLNATAAMTDAVNTADMENTTASPRFMVHSIQQLPAKDVHNRRCDRPETVEHRLS